MARLPASSTTPSAAPASIPSIPEELANTVTLHWSLRDAKNPTKILATGSSTGISQFYVAANLQTARNNALPDALEKAAEAVVSRLANGY